MFDDSPRRIHEVGEPVVQWAGADSNRGYGHPKAEGYQATPPARILMWNRPSFNGSGECCQAGGPEVRDEKAVSMSETRRYPANCA